MHDRSDSHRGPARAGDFALALLKRGFATVPRLLVDYALELGLGYEGLGKVLALMAETAGRDDVPDGEYRLSREANPQKYQEIRALVHDLAEEDLVRYDEGLDELHYSFAPLFARLQAIWQQDVEHRLAQGNSVHGPEPAPGVSAVMSQAAAGLVLGHGPEGGPGEGWLQQLAETRPVIQYAERRLGRPLTPRETSDLIDWITHYGFSEAVVQAIIDEAVERGITRFSYLNQIARAWHEEGIRTSRDAEGAQTEYRQVMAKYGRVVRHLGLNRRLTQAEQNMLDKWSNEWGFSEDVILKACDTTVNIKDPNFRYIDRVLEGWHQRGVRTVAEAMLAMQEFDRQRSTRRPRAAQGQPAAGRNEAYYDQFLKKYER